MRRFHAEVDLTSYGWQGRAGYTDFHERNEVFCWNRVSMYGESHTNPFHECRHSFIICCSEDRSQLFLTDERLRELRQPEEQVRGVLTISRREWMEYPSVDVTVSADADYVGQLHRHAEFAFIHGVGSLSVQLSFSGDDIPDLSDPQRFDGLYAVRDFHFLYWQAENVTKNDADEQD